MDIYLSSCNGDGECSVSQANSLQICLLRPCAKIKDHNTNLIVHIFVVLFIKVRPICFTDCRLLIMSDILYFEDMGVDSSFIALLLVRVSAFTFSSFITKRC